MQIFNLALALSTPLVRRLNYHFTRRRCSRREIRPKLLRYSNARPRSSRIHCSASLVIEIIYLDRFHCTHNGNTQETCLLIRHYGIEKLHSWRMLQVKVKKDLSREGALPRSSLASIPFFLSKVRRHQSHVRLSSPSIVCFPTRSPQSVMWEKSTEKDRENGKSRVHAMNSISM